MKNSRRSLACALGACVVALLAFNSPGQAGHFYAKFDMGGSLVSDMELEQFFGENIGGGDVELNPGLSFGAAGGYWVTDWFAPEAQIGRVINSIDSFGGSAQVDANLIQVPFLVNAKFQLPNKSIVTPYAGAGVGFCTSILSADEMQLGGTYMDGSEADFVFCWQAFAGVRFALSENVGLSVEYRFLAADAPSWEAENAYGTTSDRIAFGDSKTQIFSIAVDLRF